MKFLLISVMLANIFLCKSAEVTPVDIKINGAFGFKLGETYGNKSQNKTTFSLKQVPKPFRKFKNYTIAITPKSKYIYFIKAEFEAKTQQDAIEEIDIIEKIIKQKYGKRPRYGKIIGYEYYSGIFDANKNNMHIYRKNKKISIVYRSNKFNQIYYKENDEIINSQIKSTDREAL